MGKQYNSIPRSVTATTVAPWCHCTEKPVSPRRTPWEGRAAQLHKGPYYYLAGSVQCSAGHEVPGNLHLGRRPKNFLEEKMKDKNKKNLDLLDK